MGEGPVFNTGILAHIIGVLLLAGALTVQAVGSLLLRKAKTIDQVKLIAGLLRRLPLFFGAASGLILLSGLFLSWLYIRDGGAVGWLAVAVIVFLGMGAYGSITGNRFGQRLSEAIAHSNGEMTADVKEHTHDSHQINHIILSGCMLLDILLLMIYQPGLIKSVALSIGFLIVGLAVSYTRSHKAKGRYWTSSMK